MWDGERQKVWFIHARYERTSLSFEWWSLLKIRCLLGCRKAVRTKRLQLGKERRPGTRGPGTETKRWISPPTRLPPLFKPTATYYTPTPPPSEKTLSSGEDSIVERRTADAHHHHSDVRLAMRLFVIIPAVVPRSRVSRSTIHRIAKSLDLPCSALAFLLLLLFLFLVLLLRLLTTRLRGYDNCWPSATSACTQNTSHQPFQIGSIAAPAEGTSGFDKRRTKRVGNLRLDSANMSPRFPVSDFQWDEQREVKVAGATMPYRRTTSTYLRILPYRSPTSDFLFALICLKWYLRGTLTWRTSMGPRPGSWHCLYKIESLIVYVD